VRVDLVAINHWSRAIETHTKNYPWARHICASAETLDPRTIVPGGKLDLLVASPECTHFSTARGGRPVEDQLRASAWQLLRWLELLQVESLLVENVPEFRTWGPVGRKGQPLKRRRGETYAAWLGAIRSLGYNVEAQVLNAADHGDATSRRRLFVLARRGHRQIVWPTPTHAKAPGCGQKRWRAAREIIDWSLKGKSIFRRKRPLAAATMRRIIVGLERFGGPELEPFLVILRGTGTAASVDAPTPTITARGTHIGLAQPFILPPEGIHRGNAPRSIGDPLQTITQRGGGHVVDAFVMATGGPTEQMVPRSPSDPLPVIIPNTRLNVFRAFIVPQFGERDRQKPRTHSVEDPLPAATSHGAGALVEPFLMHVTHGGRVHSQNDPLPTVTGANRGELGVVEPYLVGYHGQDGAFSVGDPVPTLTTKDRIGLVQPVVDGRVLDIRFRMLQPHELAAAMGFEADYAFTGNKGEIIRQIGNAVAVNVARALCFSLLSGSPQVLLRKWQP